MTQKRLEKIRQEAKRRLSLWLTHSTFDEMTVGGSIIRFDMALGLRGYPFAKEEWMKGERFHTFLTDKEHENEHYETMIEQLFFEAKKQQHATHEQ